MRRQHHEGPTTSSQGHGTESGVTRRDVLRAGAGAAALVGAGSLFPATALAAGGSGLHPVFGLNRADRRAVSFNLRTDAAAFYLSAPGSGPDVQPVSGDEGLYADFRGSFSKTLKHNSFGEVTANSYNAYLDALESGAPADFENIPVGRENDPNRVRLVSPQAAYAFEMFGFDGNDPRMDAAPTFASAETAAEMGELYWYALTRDVPFTNYDSAPLISKAVTDLNAFSRSDIFPNDGGLVTPGTIFRGTLPGSNIGPFVSQFLLQPFEFGRLQFDGRYDRPASGGVNNFMTDFGEWLRIQRGGAPTEQTTFSGQNRFISSMRALSEFVHVDFPIQSGLYTAFVLLSFGEDEQSVPADGEQYSTGVYRFRPGRHHPSRHPWTQAGSDRCLVPEVAGPSSPSSGGFWRSDQSESPRLALL